MTLLCTAEIDMANSVAPSDGLGHLLYHHTVLKASPVTAIFGRDVLFNIPYIADWNKIGDYAKLILTLNMKTIHK